MGREKGSLRPNANRPRQEKRLTVPKARTARRPRQVAQAAVGGTSNPTFQGAPPSTAVARRLPSKQWSGHHHPRPKHGRPARCDRRRGQSSLWAGRVAHARGDCLNGPLGGGLLPQNAAHVESVQTRSLHAPSNQPASFSVPVEFCSMTRGCEVGTSGGRRGTDCQPNPCCAVEARIAQALRSSPRPQGGLIFDGRRTVASISADVSLPIDQLAEVTEPSVGVRRLHQVVRTAARFGPKRFFQVYSCEGRCGGRQGL